MIKAFSCGLLETNTYVAWDEGTRDCMIIDCGVDPQIVQPFILENNLLVKYVILTHGHFDHAHYVEEYEKMFKDAKIVCHENEKTVLFDPEANLSPYMGTHRAYSCSYTYVREGDFIVLGNKCQGECMNFQILSTPGHTPGSICLYDESHKIMFTGDTLFKKSYGRTDFKYGNMQEMYNSLRRLYKMDKDITFYPGHYEHSTIGEETNRQ